MASPFKKGNWPLDRKSREFADSEELDLMVVRVQLTTSRTEKHTRIFIQIVTRDIRRFWAEEEEARPTSFIPREEGQSKI